MFDWLKTVLQTMLRFFPFAVNTGLRAIGQPGPNSVVFVTCNFDLTVRRVTRALQGLDCYLLVAPSRGINVWCAACGGILTAHSVISVVKTSRIGDWVKHRVLILPQLSAPGIDVGLVERETGWTCQFGPVYAQDIPAYLAANFTKTDSMRQARFPLGDRLEMAVMWATPMSLVAAFPVAIFSLNAFFGVLGLIWSFSLFLFAFYEPVMRFVPGTTGLLKTLVLAFLGDAALIVWGLVLAGWDPGRMVGWSLAVFAVALVLGFDLDGSSPLNAGSTISYWGRKWPVIRELWAKLGYEFEPWFTLAIDTERCKGCATCVDVCPRGVFELYREGGKQKAQVARLARCEQCTACVKQCPEGAILAEPPIRGFS